MRYARSLSREDRYRAEVARHEEYARHCEAMAKKAETTRVRDSYLRSAECARADADRERRNLEAELARQRNEPVQVAMQVEHGQLTIEWGEVA